MSGVGRTSIVESLRRLIDDTQVRSLSDEQLLRRFVSERDEPAFEALLRRHGPMVLDVCTSLLPNAADAEDAFQACFLVLAARASSIRNPNSLSAWLHGVAYRVASQAQLEFARRRRHEGQGAAPEPVVPDDELTWREVRQVVHEELNRMSEPLREVLAHCYLQGKSQDQASLDLGLSRATLKRRLELARARLRARLIRRGVGPAGILVALTAPGVSDAADLPACCASTIAASVSLAAGMDVTAMISPGAAPLLKGALATMTLSKTTILVAVGVLLVMACSVWAMVHSAANRGAEAPVEVAPREVARNDAKIAPFEVKADTSAPSANPPTPEAPAARPSLPKETAKNGTGFLTSPEETVLLHFLPLTENSLSIGRILVSSVDRPWWSRVNSLKWDLAPEEVARLTKENDAMDFFGPGLAYECEAKWVVREGLAPVTTMRTLHVTSPPRKLKSEGESWRKSKISGGAIGWQPSLWGFELPWGSDLAWLLDKGKGVKELNAEHARLTTELESAKIASAQAALALAANDSPRFAPALVELVGLDRAVVDQPGFKRGDLIWAIAYKVLGADGKVAGHVAIYVNAHTAIAVSNLNLTPRSLAKHLPASQEKTVPTKKITLEYRIQFDALTPSSFGFKTLAWALPKLDGAVEKATRAKLLKEFHELILELEEKEINAVEFEVEVLDSSKLPLDRLRGEWRALTVPKLTEKGKQRLVGGRAAPKSDLRAAYSQRIGMVISTPNGWHLTINTNGSGHLRYGRDLVDCWMFRYGQFDAAKVRKDLESLPDDKQGKRESHYAIELYEPDRKKPATAAPVRYSLDAKALSALFTQAVHPRQLIIRGPDDILERFPPGIPMNK